MKKLKRDTLLEYCPSLVGINSSKERERLLEVGESILNALLINKSDPDYFSEDESATIKTIMGELSNRQKDLIAEIFLAKYLDIHFDPPEYSLETIKKLYNDGLYFTKSEIVEIINWEFSKPENEVNYDVVNFLLSCTVKKQYFDTLDEADAAMERYEERRKSELGGEPRE